VLISQQMAERSPLPDVAPLGDAATSAVSLRSTVVEFRRGNEALRVVDGVDLEIAPGEIVALIGPSGCGKSTLLNLVAGVLQPTSGEVRCAGAVVRGVNRRVTYLTQQDALLPWRTLVDNAALPLEIARVRRAERRRRAQAVMERVGLGGFERYMPHQVSGGMRARLALAQSLLTEADVFLMDEPFAALDALLRLRMQQLLIDLWAETGKTILYVTHDLNEAIALAHRIVVMSHRPTRVKTIHEVSLPHPRNVVDVRTSPVSNRLYEALWSVLSEELEDETRVEAQDLHSQAGR